MRRIPLSRGESPVTIEITAGEVYVGNAARSGRSTPARRSDVNAGRARAASKSRPSTKFFVGRIMGTSLDALSALTLGLFKNKILTRDQVTSLMADNVVSPGARGLADLGIVPTAIGAVIPEYLWRFRPSGQYAAIKESAKNLRKI